MKKSRFESFLLHLLSKAEIINPTGASKEEMIKEIQSELQSEWEEYLQEKQKNDEEIHRNTQ
ncbi:hypothetical protein [Fervidibacillus albus]|uniref:Uncharacterized protein n=1 Tax=Fervidibacillus albus TaxID=2980026 RepID=A0A9E8RX43_9BACI|nr:hypothetical protein [Fervidibacillus albus]WAA09137.1 hypothetical protein OE104_11135 [Fervidibacillus albus]